MFGLNTMVFEVQAAFQGRTGRLSKVKEKLHNDYIMLDGEHFACLEIWGGQAIEPYRVQSLVFYQGVQRFSEP